MAAITLATAQSMLDAYVAAELAVLRNQRYQIADRELQRAPLADIQAGRAKWQAEVNRLTSASLGRARTRYIVPGI